MRRLESLAGLAIVACALLCAGDARAQARTAQDWLTLRRQPGAEACPSSAELASGIEHQLGRSPDEVARRAGVTVIATLRVREAPGSGWQASVRLVGTDGNVLGERTIARSEKTCAPTAHAVAVIAALLLDQELPPVAPAPASASERPPPPPPPPIRPTPTDSAEPPPPPAGTSGPGERGLLTFDAGILVENGMLPNTSLGFGASAARGFGAGLLAYLRFEGWPEQRVDVEPGGRGVITRLFTLGIGGCWTPTPVEVAPTLALCFGAHGGVLAAQGVRFESNGAEALPVANLSTAVRLYQPLAAHLRLVLGARGDLALVRDSISRQTAAGEVVSVFRMAAFNPVGEFALAYEFR